MAKSKLRWVAPPGWPPAPEGWSPPSGWQPDPEWPAPPSDWEWWQPADRKHRRRDSSTQTAAQGHHQGAPLKSPAVSSQSIFPEGLVAALEEVTSGIEPEFKKVEKEIKSLRSAISDAIRPKKLRAIGSVKRVVLYETHVKVQGQVVPLSPSVRASALTMGTVKDRVLRADEDRRELTLTVEWPGGAQSAHWERNNKSAFGAMVTPGELYKMAAAINTAAANSTAARARLAANGERHQAALVEAVDRTRRHLPASLSSLRDAYHAVAAEVDSFTDETERALSRAQRSELKSARRATKAAVELEHKIVALLDPPAHDQPDGLVEVEPIDASRDGQGSSSATESLIERDPAGDEGIGFGGGGHTADINLLERLARLHDQGILSEEEFRAKKAEVLERM